MTVTIANILVHIVQEIFYPVMINKKIMKETNILNTMPSYETSVASSFWYYSNEKMQILQYEVLIYKIKVSNIYHSKNNPYNDKSI